MVILLWFFNQKYFTKKKSSKIFPIEDFVEKITMGDRASSLLRNDYVYYKRLNNLRNFKYDLFPKNLEDFVEGKGFWKKNENHQFDKYLYFNKTPDYLDKELFFNIMNGTLPDPKKSKICYQKKDH